MRLVLVTGGSLRPALIQGKGNQMPLLDERVTRSHCRMEDTVSATFGKCFLPQWLTDVCGDESWRGCGESPFCRSREGCLF